MNIWRLFIQEILYRRWNFLLTVFSVIAAVGCLTAELTILNLHDAATRRLLAEEKVKTDKRIAKAEQATKVRVAGLVDDYRKITKKLGFNILIVSDKEDIPLMDKRKFATEMMPEDYVEELANSGIMTVNHLLPMVQEEVDWPGLKGKVILNGVRGEVPLSHLDPKKPLIQPVPKGSVVTGYYVHTLLNVKKDDTVTFQGREFKVHETHGYRGTKDDWTVWMNLEEAQNLLDRKGKINIILALECNCATVDRLAEIRADVKKALPNTEVLEVYTEALVRAEARQRAVKEARDALAHEKEEARAELLALKESQAGHRRQLSGFAALLIPLVLLGSIVWLGIMTLSNVYQRQGEIGILRALGLSSGSVYVLFIGRAMVVGLVGAIIGYGLGVFAGTIWSDSNLVAAGGEALFDPLLLSMVLIATPALCALVGWMSATVAAQQDPAVILQQS